MIKTRNYKATYADGSVRFCHTVSAAMVKIISRSDLFITPAKVTAIRKLPEGLYENGICGILSRKFFPGVDKF